MEVERRLLPKSSSIFHPFSPDQPSIDKGGYSKDGKVLWSWNCEVGISLYSVPELTFVGWVPTGGHQLETHGQLTYGSANLLLLVLNDQTQSLLIVVSMATTQLVRVVKLPYHVTSISGVSHMTFPGLFIQSPLSLFSGIVVCGCRNGRVILIDLALDHSHSWPRPNLSYPRHCHVLPYTTDSIPVHINNSIEEGIHLTLDLNSKYIQKNKVFQYCEPNNKLIGSFEGVLVTALYHVPQLCGLLVGYSFGGFQLYSLTDSNLIFSSPVILRRLEPPVTHFTFQEPENDPRSFVYIWITRNGPPAQAMFGSSPSITLYQLAFKKKIESQGAIYYQELEGCLRRFEYILWPWHQTSAVMLACYTVERYISASDVDSSLIKTTPTVLDRTLAVFICRGLGNESGRGIMVVFDLNCWYHCQMPLHPCWSPADKPGRQNCPFLSVYELTGDEGCVLGAYTYSFAPFSSPPPVMESHVWPETLTIRLNLLTTAGISECVYQGVQSQVISDLMTYQTDIMTNPEHFISLCRQVDLLQSSETTNTITREDQQHLLLSVCLNYNLKSLLADITKSSLTPGYHTSSVCIYLWIKKVLEEFVEEKSVIINQLIGRSTSVDKNIVTRSEQIVQHLSVLSHLISLLSVSSSLDNEELQTQFDTAEIHKEVLQVVHWCMLNKLLPYSLDTDTLPSEEGTFVFPVAGLTSRYDMLEQQRINNGLAIDLLIKDLPLTENVPFNYPPNDISCIMCARAYPTTLSQQCLILYILYDIATPPGNPCLARSYVVHFELIDVLNLAQTIWSIDHATPNLDQAKELKSLFPKIYELGIQRLIREDNPCEAIYSLSMGVAHCTQLHIQALIAAGHIGKAFHALEECEGTEDYLMLLEQFVKQCLTSPYCDQMIRLQLNREQLEEMCRVLTQHGGERAIHLSLTLLLQHRCYVEAIALAQEREREGGILGLCLSRGSALLPPSKQGMCSMDLLKKLQGTHHIPIDVPKPLSAVLSKKVDYKFTTQADLIVEITNKISEVRDVLSDPVTPFRQHTPKTTVPRRTLSSLPFVSSPQSISRRTPRTKKLPTIAQVSTKSSSKTSSKGKTEMGQFLAHMQGFQTRMAILSTMTHNDVDSVIRTPIPYKLGATPAPPASILKPKLDHGQLNVDEYPAVGFTPANRKIRFALEDSLEKSKQNTSTIVSSTTPLPQSDDSDLYYSPGASPLEDSLELGGVKPSHTDKLVGGINLDHVAADVVITTEEMEEEREMSGQDEKEDSFIASAEEEEQLISSTQLSTIVKKSSDTNVNLTRDSLQSLADLSRKTTPAVQKKQDFFSPVMGLERQSKTPKQIIKRSSNQSNKTVISRHSSVMVNLPQDQSSASYQFSSPHTVTPPPKPQTNPLQPIEPSSEPIQPFVFSPPLLRSASKQRKEKEFSRTGIEEATPPRTSSSKITPTLHEKRVRSVKGPRRSQRLLGGTKK